MQKPSSMPTRLRWTRNKDKNEIETWATSGSEKTKHHHEALSKSMVSTKNAMHEEVLKSKLQGLSKEQHKFLLQFTYEKKIFINKQQRKLKSVMLGVLEDSQRPSASNTNGWFLAPDSCYAKDTNFKPSKFPPNINLTLAMKPPVPRPTSVCLKDRFSPPNKCQNSVTNVSLEALTKKCRLDPRYLHLTKLLSQNYIGGNFSDIRSSVKYNKFLQAGFQLSVYGRTGLKREILEMLEKRFVKYSKFV